MSLCSPALLRSSGSLVVIKTIRLHAQASAAPFPVYPPFNCRVYCPKPATLIRVPFIPGREEEAYARFGVEVSGVLMLPRTPKVERLLGGD